MDLGTVKKKLTSGQYGPRPHLPMPLHTHTLRIRAPTQPTPTLIYADAQRMQVASLSPVGAATALNVAGVHWSICLPLAGTMVSLRA